MKYSTPFRNAILKKVLPPESQNISSVAEESGVSEQVIRNWMKKLKSGTLLENESETAPGSRTAAEKLRILLESQTVEKSKKGEWLRSRGLHEEHLPLFEQELENIVKNKADDLKKQLRQQKNENQKLQSELRRKEKALAEMAALLTLKKKADSIWGEPEDDASHPTSVR